MSENIRVRRPQGVKYSQKRSRRASPTVTFLVSTVKYIAAVGLAVAVAFGGFYGWKMYSLQADISTGQDLGLGANEFTPLEDGGVSKTLDDGAIDVLLVGADSRTDVQGNPLTPDEIAMLRAGDEQNTNTDTLIVARIDPKNATITGVSIPRDSYIKDRTFGNTKINAVYAMHKNAARQEWAEKGIAGSDLENRSSQAGRAALIEAVGSLTGVTIDRYAEVGLLGFVLLSDAVGGVPVCLNNPVNEPLSGANFPAGPQTLSGADGLSFVRQRYDLPRGDLDRITRQQVYMASLARQVLSAGTLTNPSAVNDLMDAVRRSVLLDADWDVPTLLGQLKNISGSNIRFETIPVVTIDGRGDNGESVVEVDVAQVQRYFTSLLGVEKETSEDAIQAAISARVFNATDIEGRAKEIADKLSAGGVTVTEIGTSTQYGVESSVKVHPDSLPAAKTVAEKLGFNVSPDPSLQPGSVIVIAGPPAPVNPTPPSVPTGAGLGVTAGGNGATCVN